MTKLYLFDIEGTTTDVQFVHKVLFPYSRSRMNEFLLGHLEHPEVREAVAAVKETVLGEEELHITNYEVVNVLEKWIDQDRKHGALKVIQGHIWESGYARGDFQGHVYPDVKECFERIRSAGAKIGIYSSGSEHAQKLLLSNSSAGDLTPFINHYFDTRVGGKREAESYRKIALATGLPAGEIHFFSDIAEELEAAKAAGMQVTQLLRPGTRHSTFPGIADFSAVP
jgi:enolase-phosphatase E1